MVSGWGNGGQGVRWSCGTVSSDSSKRQLHGAYSHAAEPADEEKDDHDVTRGTLGHAHLHHDTVDEGEENADSTNGDCPSVLFLQTPYRGSPRTKLGHTERSRPTTQVTKAPFSSKIVRDLDEAESQRGNIEEQAWQCTLQSLLLEPPARRRLPPYASFRFSHMTEAAQSCEAAKQLVIY